MRPNGKPAGPVRLALLAALQAGVVGTLDAMARHAGVPADKARITLANLRREGVACSWRSDIPVCPAKRRVGRPPVVYGPQAAIDGGSLDALAFVRQAWR